MKELSNKIKLIRRVIDHGYSKAFLYSNNDEDRAYLNTLKDKDSSYLLDEIKNLKESKISNRDKSPYIKFCISKCQREFIPKDGYIQIYCSSCDRVINQRPIKNF